MTWATRKNTKEGDIVIVPLQNEWMRDEQICEEYEVVLALKKKTHPSKIVGEGQEQNPEWMKFSDEMAYLLTKEE